jgi:hypothetical protein
MRRHNLVIRRISGSGRTLPKDCVNTIKSYLDFVQIRAREYEKKEIFAYDETSVFMDSFGSYSIETKGFF